MPSSLVVGPETADLAQRLECAAEIVTVVQDPPRGTGDAVKCALTALREVDRLVVLYSDHPLLEPSTVAKLLAGLRASGARVAILTAIVQDPGRLRPYHARRRSATGGDRRTARR